MSRSFQRRKEAFQCAHCGAWVEGDGYTNHCPHCLWSLHVDLAPGDRAEPCHGLMEPVAVLGDGDAYVIYHRCTKCGTIRRNRAAANDNREALLALAGRPIPEGIPPRPKRVHRRNPWRSRKNKLAGRSAKRRMK